MDSTQLGLYGRTCPESYPTRPTDSAACSEHWLEVVPPSFRLSNADGLTRVWLLDPGDPLHGGSWTPSGSAWPNDGSACLCSLVEVLEPSVSRKFYLSGKACAGILRRAERRGKELPTMLRAALEAVAGSAAGATTPTEPRSSPVSGGGNTSGAVDVATARSAKAGSRDDFDSETFVTFTQNQRDELRELGDAAGACSGQGTHQTTYVATFDPVNVTSKANRSRVEGGLPCHTLHEGAPALCFEPGSIARRAGLAGEQETVSTLRSEMGDNQPAIRCGMMVRRLTPRECCRLQGFPDDWTLIEVRGKDAADGPRYKALGNSMAVPVMAWIGRRIEEVET